MMFNNQGKVWMGKKECEEKLIAERRKLSGQNERWRCYMSMYRKIKEA